MHYHNIDLQFKSLLIELSLFKRYVSVFPNFLSILTYHLCRIRVARFYDNHFIHLILSCITGCIAMEAYCVKCKSKREMRDEKKVTMKNGKPATQGICTVCGTKMFKIGK